jgi:hypothetical protein
LSSALLKSSTALVTSWVAVNGNDGGRPSVASASPYCTQGTGEGCGNLSEGNAYIQSLQEKSAANKDKYARVRKTLNMIL